MGTAGTKGDGNSRNFGRAIGYTTMRSAVLAVLEILALSGVSLVVGCLGS